MQEVARIWVSEELQEYLENCAYDNKRCVEAKIVKGFLDLHSAHPLHSAKQGILYELSWRPSLGVIRSMWHQLVTISVYWACIKPIRDR